jgi:hypothetical protein
MNCPTHLRPTMTEATIPTLRFLVGALYKVWTCKSSIDGGNLVFQTTDPNISWRGVNENGKELSEGTYFYVCKVYESRVGGVVLRPGVLQGYIELVRG